MTAISNRFDNNNYIDVMVPFVFWLNVDIGCYARYNLLLLWFDFIVSDTKSNWKKKYRVYQNEVNSK